MGIPACAGDPCLQGHRRASYRRHPRVCGGPISANLGWQLSYGLSPRVRGNRSRCLPYLLPVRSIPACAGEPGRTPCGLSQGTVYPRVCGGTHPPLSHSPPPWVYPRVCGGTASGGRSPYTYTGLSPRVRGNPRLVSVQGPGYRVYPRVCGGTGVVRPPRGLASGLSPRVRGNHSKMPGFGCQPRSIPACAGEPVPRQANAGPISVYPRVCGGTTVQPCRRRSCVGLSPRVRGNRRHLCKPRYPVLSIPACAGEPSRGAMPGVPEGVYPRVCGGTHRMNTPRQCPRGLSPRVRGNRIPRPENRPSERSIPACAGEPR